jgi:MYXO-CTERM domain-containing protein
MASISRNHPIRSLRLGAAALAFGVCLSMSSIALAGEIKVGPAKLAVDGEGKLTDEGRKAAKDEIPSEPGEEVWIVHLWAKLDKPAPGGLNVEFHGQLPDGKSYLAYSEAEEGFDGGKYLSMELELEGSKGFNKNKSYDIVITQLDEKGKQFKLATGKVKLGWTPAPKAEGEGGGEGGDDGEEPEDSAAQDALDTLSGGGDGGGDDGNAASGAPPPVEKKGCAIDSDAGGALGVLVLFALGASGTMRRRR